MKKNIQAIINELGLASVDEIKSVLKECLGEVKSKTLATKLGELEKEKVIFKVLSEENSQGIEGFIAGPNMSAEDDFDIKRIIIEQGLEAQDLEGIKWEKFSSRLLKALLDDLKGLQDDLKKTYDDPKSIEMKYFELSIVYHELYGFFLEKYNTNVLVPAEASLTECRDLINRKEI
jgi:hypothetical protein